MSEVVLPRDANWVGSEVEDSFVMTKIDSAVYVALNRTAHASGSAGISGDRERNNGQAYRTFRRVSTGMQSGRITSVTESAGP